ncbi:MAG: TonB-dependent receptor [bacterium]|nr:TonB-dependent receptor [bacterium]
MLKKCLLLLLITALSISLFPAKKAATATTADTGKDDETMFTEEVEVVGNIPVIQAIQSVSVYKNEEIRKYNFDNLKSLLSLTPGLLTLSSGQFGQSSSTYIRGSKSTQVLYIVDGIKLRDGASIGGVNLAILSPAMMEKVEVVRGPLSSMYGSDAMGGVVSMNTSSREGAEFSASFGNHNSYSGQFSGSKTFNNINLGLSLNTQRFSDDVVNDVFKNTGLNARLNYKNEKVNTGLRFFGSFSDSGIPINYGLSTPNRQYKRNYFIVALPFAYSFNRNSKIDMKLAYTKSKYEFEDPDDTYNSYFRSLFDNYEVETTYFGKFNNLNLRVGVDYSYQNIVNETPYSRTLDDEKMSYFSGYTTASYKLKALQLSASVRLDKYKNVDINVSPQVGLSYLINNRIKLRASYSHSFLAPLVSQQVNPWGAANFGLAPEKGKSFEAGIEYYSKKLVLSGTYFNTRYQDMINWVTIDWTTYQGQYRNIDNVDTYGYELAATYRPVHTLMVSASYGYLHSENMETGEALVRKPKHIFSGAVVYTNKKFTLSANVVYVGKRPDLDYTASPPEVESQAYNSFDLSAVVPVYKGFSIFGKLTNVFDKDYQEVIGYPAPGRRFQLGFKYQIK